MSYIFRLNNEGDNAFADWGGTLTKKYGTTVIDHIKDPNGESPKREITSIPSPFARIDLVKTAFGKVATMGVDGNTIHHRMVSDALDIGQIFFEYEKFANQFEILVWNKENDLNALLDSPFWEHQLLGRTYEIYLKQDGAMYNFAQMNSIYLLNYKNGPNITNIIGATSPATLFFTPANNLKYVGNTIRFGNDYPFDDDYAPLYKRDLEYQKFWYLLRITNRDFPKLFPEVDRYLDENFKKLSAENKNIILSLNKSNMEKYVDVVVSGQAGNVVYLINGMPMKQKVQDTAIIEKSGFLLAESNYCINNKKPLVLPIDTYTKPTKYTLENWDKNTPVPFVDPVVPGDRILPADGSKYPYLTVSDFLTDTIVRMPYEIDKINFFDGNLDKSERKEKEESGSVNVLKFSYMLPLKDLFFECFTVEQLKGNVKNGKKMFELNKTEYGVKAILRIPVANDVIEYSRNYWEVAAENILNNDGHIIEKRFGLGIMPLIRFPENVQKHYRIAVFDKGEYNIQLMFYDGENVNAIDKQRIERFAKDLNNKTCSIEAYSLEQNFDRIKISVGNRGNGFIVPIFKKPESGKQFTFAIDFGTTNTHIEYCTNEIKEQKEFNIKANEIQMHKLHTQYADPDIRKGFELNFIPDTIGDNDIYSFPMRTVFALRNNKKEEEIYVQNPITLADGNIPFLYEKEKTPGYNKIKTELKWGGVDNRLLEMYFENISILLRNKAIIDGGDLPATKIVWFFPASMRNGEINKLNDIWKKAYNKYFGGNVDKQVICISESVAPFIYYRENLGGSGRAVNIDIGGGTTDVYVVENDIPKMLMSFRFASNAVFGDGYNWKSGNNGFVKTYLKKFEKILEENNLKELLEALEQIEAQKSSPDIIAFLFSLTGKKVKDNPSLNLLEELKSNDKMRYVFIIFYGAILYFIAKSMKAKKIKNPLSIGFSGNGSHTLRILSSDEKSLKKFAQLIFDTVYGKEGIGEEITRIIFDKENPKKATCKGGLKDPQTQNYDSIKSIKSILVGNDMNVIADDKVSYSDINTDEVKNGILHSVTEFFEFLFKLHTDNDDFFFDYFSADPTILPLIKKECLNQSRLRESLEDGLKYKYKEAKNDMDTKLEETLFFYPLIGLLHNLALEISNM